MSLRPETRAVHSAATDPSSGAIVPPIVLSTTFEYETTGLDQDPDQLIYTRWQNPNRAALESTPWPRWKAAPSPMPYPAAPQRCSPSSRR